MAVRLTEGSGRRWESPVPAFVSKQWSANSTPSPVASRRCPHVALTPRLVLVRTDHLAQPDREPAWSQRQGREHETARDPAFAKRASRACSLRASARIEAVVRAGRRRWSQGGDERRRPPNRALLLSPKLSGAPALNRATRATIALPESDRPDGRDGRGTTASTLAPARAALAQCHGGSRESALLLQRGAVVEGSATASGRSSRPPPLLQPWQRHSEARAAARAEAVVARSVPARLDVGDCDSAPGLLGGRFRASTITCCTGTGRTEGRCDLNHAAVAWPRVAVISSLPAHALLPIVRSGHEISDDAGSRSQRQCGRGGLRFRRGSGRASPTATWSSRG